MSSPTTCGDSHSAISSQESASGPTRSALPVGKTLDLFGRVPAPASPSLAQGSSSGQPTSATCGPRGSGSSASAALQTSLASRLRDRLPLPGLTLYRLTWKTRVTPLGRPICALRASGLRTSDSDCTGWPTTNATDGKGASTRTPGKERPPCDDDLPTAVIRNSAGWPTPRREDSESTGAHRGTPDTLHSASQLAGWSTPRANKWGFPDAHGSHEAPVAGWATPTAAQKRRSEEFQKGRALTPPEAFGAPLIGCHVGTETHGQMNPAQSRWLTGLPAAWDDCAPTGTRSVRR